LTVGADTDVAAHAICLGASGFMTKASAFDELATAIDEVLQGRIYITRAADSDVVLPDGSQPAGRRRG
jgi:DNA-binding NarL/FixJ family response regulator